jgi:hypothetical protein
MVHSTITFKIYYSPSYFNTMDCLDKMESTRNDCFTQLCSWHFCIYAQKWNIYIWSVKMKPHKNIQPTKITVSSTWVKSVFRVHFTHFLSFSSLSLSSICYSSTVKTHSITWQRQERSVWFRIRTFLLVNVLIKNLYVSKHTKTFN